MIIARLTGGLGNQLFQYATARALAERTQSKLKLDATRYLHDAKRSYRLNVFHIAASLATEQEVNSIAPPRKKSVAWVDRKARNLFLPGYRDPVVREKSGDLCSFRTRQMPRRVYLIGYWQSEHYFRNEHQIIKRDLRFKFPPDAVNQSLLQQIERTESVAIHIRRGDYVSNPATNRIHGVLGLDYYSSALDIVANQVRNPHLFVFSDDIEWAMQNLSTRYPAVFIGHNGPDKDYEDLRLMSACKHQIIANSSFSWWGAWLNENPQKVIVCPRTWFSAEEMKRRGDAHIAPKGWVRV